MMNPAAVPGPEVPLLPLNDGTTLPAVALGTYKLNGAPGVAAMVSAIRQGYRLLDSAFNYENEGAVGRAVRESGVPREQIQVTSKLPGRHHRYDEAIATVQESLYRAGLDYYDLYLIHWPNPGVGRYVEAYTALVDLQKQGLIRSVGVSNFLEEHLTAVTAATGITPAVNQIELHPYFPQTDALALHGRLGIQTESWSPVGRGNTVASEPVIVEIAENHDRTPIEVILRWHTQRGSIPLPKSSNSARQLANLSIFDFSLDDDELAAITGLGRADGRLQDQDPAVYEEM